MGLDEPYKNEYADINSKESLIFISTVEPRLLQLMKSNSVFGHTVGRVKITRLHAGSVEVDFVVVLSKPLMQPSYRVSLFLNNSIQQRRKLILEMGVKNDSVITAQG